MLRAVQGPLRLSSDHLGAEVRVCTHGQIFLPGTQNFIQFHCIVWLLQTLPFIWNFFFIIIIIIVSKCRRETVTLLTHFVEETTSWGWNELLFITRSSWVKGSRHACLEVASSSSSSSCSLFYIKCMNEALEVKLKTNIPDLSCVMMHKRVKCGSSFCQRKLTPNALRHVTSCPVGVLKSLPPVSYFTAT